jgi:hypothetical protein
VLSAATGSGVRLLSPRLPAPPAGYPFGVTAPTLPRSAASPLVRAGAGAVRALSLVRGERVLHARGLALRGRLTVPGGAATGATLFDRPGTYDVVLRLSRSLGLPVRAPDILGFALRVVDAYGAGRPQDLLLDSTLTAPVLRRLPVPALGVLGATYCSLLPYDTPTQRLLIGARGAAGSPRVSDLASLPRPSSFDLLVATPHGPWQPVGVVRVEDDLPAPDGRRLRFAPGHTGGGLREAGPFQGWRRASYPASHVGPDA